MSDLKISEMLGDATPEGTDIVPFVRSSAVTNKNRYWSLLTLLANIPSKIISHFPIIYSGHQTVTVGGAMVISAPVVNLIVGSSPVNVIVPNGTDDGQEISFIVESTSANITITPINAIGFSNCLLTSIGKTFRMRWSADLSKWYVLSTYGGTIS